MRLRPVRETDGIDAGARHGLVGFVGPATAPEARSATSGRGGADRRRRGRLDLTLVRPGEHVEQRAHPPGRVILMPRGDKVSEAGALWVNVQRRVTVAIAARPSTRPAVYRSAMSCRAPTRILASGLCGRVPVSPRWDISALLGPIVVAELLQWPSPRRRRPYQHRVGRPDGDAARRRARWSDTRGDERPRSSCRRPVRAGGAPHARGVDAQGQGRGMPPATA